MIPATAKNIEWLLERLHWAKRDLLTDGVENPVFVLLTKDREDRNKVEQVIFAYLVGKYGGGEFLDKVTAGSNTPNSTRIYLGDIGASIILVDI